MAAAIAEVLNDGLPSGEHTAQGTIRKALQRELKRGLGSRITTSGGQWRLRDETE